MITKQLFTKIIIGLVVLILLFIIIPKFNFSTKSNKSFGVLKKGSNTVSMPASLKLGSDFNYNYKKTTTGSSDKNKAEDRKNRFKYFKDKKN